MENKFIRGGFTLLTPNVIANNFIKKSLDENIPVTPLKLQKLVYFLYAKYLKETNRKLFTERFETWKYGPVIPSIYAEFNSYQNKPIKTMSKDSTGKSYRASEIDEFGKCIDEVWETYKNYTGSALSDMTHEPDTAWTKAKEEGNLYLKDEDIKNEKMV